ncbi:MAG: hypothetical protein R3F61_29370 [Myxococcota bacterium]
MSDTRHPPVGPAPPRDPRRPWSVPEGPRDTTLHVVWQQVDAALTDELVAFWTGANALSPEVARGRAPEVAVVARDASGAIVAVSSAVAKFSPALRVKLFHTRVFVAQPARRQRLAMEVFATARDTLEDAWLDGLDPECIGLLVEVESPLLKAHRNQAVWETGPVFVGRNARGDHIRVYWFSGARIT